MQFTLKMCIAARNREKFTKNFSFWGFKVIKNFSFRGSRSFEVIDVDTLKKLVTSACYDKQDV